MIEELLEQQDALVDVDDLCVQFETQEVLRHIVLKIPAGQTVAILGESFAPATQLLFVGQQ